MSVPLSENGAGAAGPYEIGVAIMPLSADLAEWPEPPDYADAIPGYEDTLGRGGGQHSVRPAVIQKGEAALGAIDAVAAHIGLIAQRIGTAIGSSAEASAQPGAAFGLESVQVSFGITLSAGVQTVFTAEAESSAQVTLTLTRRP